MLPSRDELIAALFRETDRAQRMRTPLAVILCGIDGWESRRAGLPEQVLAGLEGELSARIVRMLRCYDTAGRYGDGEFGLVLPGCNRFHAVGMAERLSSFVFGASVRAGDQDLYLPACFGVASSGGRSPLVVLRNAESALQNARARGMGSIEQCSYDAEPDRGTLPIPVCRSKGTY